MEKTNINFKESGITTLKVVSNIILFFSIITAVGYIVYAFAFDAFIYALYGAIFFLSGLFLFGLGLCISSIARNSLYQTESLNRLTEKK